jgi:hypothetical protein
MSASSPATPHDPATTGPQAAALPRLLAGIPPEGAMTLEDHLAVHGAPPSARGRGRRQDRERAELLIAEIERSGLLGRGGAAFPTAVKMRAVAASRGRAIVVVNAAEGEPASLKDRTLLEALPHLVLDGGMLAAQAVGADELVICLCESSGELSETVLAAIEERARAGEYASLEQTARVEVASVPGHYVAGQETALINYALRAWPAPPPHPRQQRRDPRPCRADRAPRGAVVPATRHADPARLRPRDAVGAGRPTGRV